MKSNNKHYVFSNNDRVKGGQRCHELNPGVWQYGLKVIERLKEEDPDRYFEIHSKGGKLGGLKGGKASVKVQHESPNGLEQKFIELIEKYNLPFQYVGNGETWIGSKNPDFVSTNGEKIVIELFGNYWHGKERIGVSNKQHEQDYINHYAQYGFKCIILWEHELHTIEGELKDCLFKYCITKGEM